MKQSLAQQIIALAAAMQGHLQRPRLGPTDRSAGSRSRALELVQCSSLWRTVND